MTTIEKPNEKRTRVIGFDLLRGLCALAVAAYHMLYWSKTAHLHNLGLYGVYVFFILSGASMTIAYAPRFEKGYAFSKYLALRFLRLSPLYALVTCVSTALLVRGSGFSFDLAVKFLLNVTFLMGLANPGTTALVTGGWSLGIEFVFYLVFPLVAAVAQTRWFRWSALALCGVQVLFVNQVLSGLELDAAWGAYTQFASFVGYFAAGVLIGVAVNRRALDESGFAAWAAWVLLLVALATQSGATARESLVGIRGVLMTAVSIALVAVAARLPIRGVGDRIAGMLGDASYPLYLVHPLVFTVLGSRFLFRSLLESSPLVFVGGALAASLAVSLATWRWFEKPILEWGKRRLA